MKKLTALMLALALCLGMVVISASAEEPIKITIFVDGTIPDHPAWLSAD